MKFITLLLLIFVISVSISCNENNKGITLGDSFREIPLATQQGGEPNIFVSKGGEVYLSWVEYLNDTTDALVFSTLENEKWTAPQTIATGSDWFVNWADFPSLVAYKDGKSLAAHWLQKRAAGTYDYDVRISQSMDRGKTWNPSFIPHRDGIAAEHGFVSMLPFSDDKIFATWLDGRNTKGEGHDAATSHDSHGHGSHGAMTLRTALFDKKGNLTEEAELDNRICDCCQTAATITDKGVIVAYRDRSEKEIRDIYIVRKVKGEWTSPKPVYNDNWLITGCPVNGPSLDADGKNVVIAWFTMKDEKPEVKVAFSTDSGANFDLPIKVDEGNSLGRVDVVMVSKGEALVSWLEQTNDAAAIKTIRVNQAGRVGESFTISASKASRQSGFPRMVKNKNQIIFAWTHADSLTKVKTAVMNF